MAIFYKAKYARLRTSADVATRPWRTPLARAAGPGPSSTREYHKEQLAVRFPARQCNYTILRFKMASGEWGMGNGGRGQLHISAIPQLHNSTIPQSHMGATRDHETRRLAERRSAAGMPRRRFDLKVAVSLHSPFPFPIPLRATFVKRRRAIPTFGFRQAPRHEPGYARHEYTRILALRKQLSYHPMFHCGATQPPASLAVHPTATRPYCCLTAKA